MEKPEKKDIPEDIGNPMFGWSYECGYNEAIDKCMAWHKEEVKRILKDIQFKWYYRGILKVIDLAAVEDAIKDLEGGE